LTLYFFLFLLIFVPITVFADTGNLNYEQCPNAEEFLANIPISDGTISCHIDVYCQPFHNDELTIKNIQSKLAKDYLVKIYLANKSNFLLDDLVVNNDNVIFGSVYKVPNIHNDSGFTFHIDRCGTFGSISYGEGENGFLHSDFGVIGYYDYQGNKLSPSKLKEKTYHVFYNDNREKFQNTRYEIAKEILGKHTPPKIQTTEFERFPQDVHCNDGLSLYSYKDKPYCLKPSTYEKLSERLDILSYS